MVMDTGIKSRRDLANDSSFNGSNVSSPISIDITPSFVINIEKPSESIDDLCMLAKRYFGTKIDYNIKNGIVTCNEVATSIPPEAFDKLNEREKFLISKFPNSDISIALLQKARSIV